MFAWNPGTGRPGLFVGIVLSSPLAPVNLALWVVVSVLVGGVIVWRDQRLALKVVAEPPLIAVKSFWKTVTISDPGQYVARWRWHRVVRQRSLVLEGDERPAAVRAVIVPGSVRAATSPLVRARLDRLHAALAAVGLRFAGGPPETPGDQPDASNVAPP